MRNLDLHGVKHSEVDVMVEEHVLRHKAPFQIITGNSNTMRKIVKTVLDRHDYKYWDDLPHNTGCILVLSE